MNNFFIFILFLLIPTNVLAVSTSSTFVVDLDVNNCNNNGTCESLIGEDYSTCSNDCQNTSTTTTSTVTTPVTSGGGGGGGVVIVVPPPNVVLNVQNLLALPGDSNVVLSWNVLDNINYGGVIIRRSIIFPPITMTDGGILYSGKGDLVGEGKYTLNDVDLKNGQWYFYTVFLYDKQGNYSSGASVSALPQSEKMKEDLKDLVIPPKKLPPELSIPLKNLSTTTKPIYPTIIDLNQNDKLIEFKIDAKTKFELVPNVTTTVLVKNNDVPVGTTAIMVTIENKMGFQSFVLNKDDTGSFNLTIPAGNLSDGGNLSFTFIDKDKQAIERIVGSINTAKISTILKKTSIIKAKYIVLKNKAEKLVSTVVSKLIDLNKMVINLSVLVIKYLKNWFNFLGILVIHK